MNRKIAILIGIVLLISCSKKPIQVTPLDSTATLSTSGMIYALPRTILKIKVEAINTIVVPGPYCRFAQKYLGITDVPLKKTDGWGISNIDINSAVESDPFAFFAVNPEDESKIDFLKICNTGLIIPVSGFGVNSLSQKDFKNNEVEGKTYYSDLSTTPFIATEKTTYYSKVKHDSVFVRVPIQKEMIIEKNIEEKARDAADFIFLLRKRRSDFLSVDADHNLNGDGLKIALDEINRLEQEYLTLFVGKTFTENAAHFFEYIPSQLGGESSIIFRFSPSKGILPSSDLSGNPVLLKTIPEPIPDSYKNFFQNISMEKDKPLNNVVYYRIPNTTIISISDGKKEVVNRRFSIYQYGLLVRMPIKLMIKDSGLIEFTRGK